MGGKRNGRAVIILTSMIFFGMSLWCMGKPKEEFSPSERRHLAEIPKFTADEVLSGRFMRHFEEYAADQFPMREEFRRLNSVFQFYVLGKKEVNNIYVTNGYAEKLMVKADRDAAEKWLNRILYICDTYAGDNRVFLSLIPDKNYFFSRESGYPFLDYQEFTGMFLHGTRDVAEYIPLEEVLSLENYYATDLHWKQETLEGVADTLAGGMGISLSFPYDVGEVDAPFYGVYYGQASLPLKPDKLKYLYGPLTEKLIVTCYDSGKPEKIPLYDMEKAYGRDAYEMFLSGSKALLTIENPESKNDRELVMFRDSFGSSLAPLLAEGYKKITLVDIRYISMERIGEFVDFEGADVLFLYHLQVLNS